MKTTHNKVYAIMPYTRFTYLFIILVLTTCTPTKTVVKKYKRSKDVFCEYEVDRTNKLVKNGRYTSFYKSISDKEQKTKEKGQFINGQKNGEWVIYKNGGGIDSIGNYLFGNKVGVWSIYHKYGNVIERYNFDTKKFLDPSVRVEAKYPELAIENNISGVVKIEYELSEDCYFINIQVIDGIGYGCDEAAVKAVEIAGTRFNSYCRKEKCDLKTDTLEVPFVIIN